MASPASTVGVHAKQAKHLYQSQLARLNDKASQDATLLDHTAQFIKKRLDIERDAADKLAALTKHYAKVAAAAAAAASPPTSSSKSPAANNANPDVAGDATPGASPPHRELSPPPTASASASASATSPAEKPTLRVFNALLAQTDARVKQTLALCDSLSATAIDPSRTFVRDKQIATAKCVEAWRATQENVVSTLLSLAEKRKEYDEAAKEASHATKKHADLSAGKSSVLSSVKAAFSSATDEERVAKAATKMSVANRRLTETRNAYLLALTASNAAQTAYWEKELPDFMDRLDGEFHPTFAKTVSDCTQAEAELWAAIRSGLVDIAEACRAIDRDQEQSAFLHVHGKSFPGPSVFSHDPAPNDAAGSSSSRLVVPDDQGRVLLSNALHELKTRRQQVAKEYEKSLKEVAGLEQMAKVYSKTPEFGNAANPMDTKLSLELQSIALSVQLKAIESQIQLLEDSGISVMSAVISVDISSAQGGAAAAARLSLVDVRRDPEPSAVTAAESPADAEGLGKARVLFSYDAQEASELSIREGQVLTVLEADQGGWTKASLDGVLGFVPSGYIVTLSSPPSSRPPTLPRPAAAQTSSATGSRSNLNANNNVAVNALFDYTPQAAGELGFQAGDMIYVLDTRTAPGAATSEWWDGQNARTNESGLFPYMFTEGWENALTKSTAGTGPRTSTVARATPPPPATRTRSRRGSVVSSHSRMSRSITPAAAPPLPNGGAMPPGERVTALFEYVASCAGELTLHVGDVVVVTNKSTGSDAWWEGRNERTGEVGQFPRDYTAAV